MLRLHLDAADAEKARELLDQHPMDRSACFMYTRALIEHISFFLLEVMFSLPSILFYNARLISLLNAAKITVVPLLPLIFRRRAPRMRCGSRHCSKVSDSNKNGECNQFFPPTYPLSSPFPLPPPTHLSCSLCS